MEGSRGGSRRVGWVGSMGVGEVGWGGGRDVGKGRE